MHDLTHRLGEDLKTAQGMLQLFRSHPSSTFYKFLEDSIAELEIRLAQSIARDEEQQRLWGQA